MARSCREGSGFQAINSIDSLAPGWKWGRMQDDYTRGQHYKKLATQMRAVAKLEPDARRKNELLDLARQYDRLAEKLAKEIRH